MSSWDNAADWADISFGGLENEELFVMTSIYTFLYPDTPSLIIVKGDSIDGSYRDLEPFSYSLSDQEIKEMVRAALCRN